ncbi:MAG: extracytoplasmic binding receptor, partial [Hyphomicrobiales bacterium]|nr:extracytoplasmic binding receptor [Hyphomicrobiales bacterium]
ADIGTVLPLSEGGKLKILASTTKEPPTIAKDIPTIAAVGMPDLLSDTWTAFTAPPGTPLDVREKLAAGIKEVMFTPQIKSRLEAVGIEPWGLGPQEMAEVVKKESQRWTDVVRKADVRIQ